VALFHLSRPEVGMDDFFQKIQNYDFSKINRDDFSTKLSKLAILSKSITKRFTEIKVNNANANARHILENRIIENSTTPASTSSKAAPEEKQPCNSFWHEKRHDQVSITDGSHLIKLFKNIERNITQKEKINSIMNLLKCIKTLNFTFSLFQGLLLGSYRNESIIPWDQDGDILMYTKDWSKYLMTENCISCPNTTLIVRRGTDSNIVVGKFTDITNGVYVDVWVYNIENNDMVGLFPYLYQVHKSFHFDFVDCKLNGVQFKCIRTPEKYLAHFYGKHFMIPVNIYYKKINTK